MLSETDPDALDFIMNQRNVEIRYRNDRWIRLINTDFNYVFSIMDELIKMTDQGNVSLLPIIHTDRVCP